MALAPTPPTTTPSTPLIDHAKVVNAPCVLLVGAPGSGKTYSITTLLEAGLKVFVIITEPGGLETLLDTVIAKRLPIDNLHYRVISPARAGFDALASMAKNVSIMGFDSLSKMQPTNRSNAQFITIVACCKSFVCERTGIDYGNISDLGSDSAVVIDSLSGLSLMAMDLTIGDKVTAHMGEWGVAMGMLDKFILNLTSNLKALLVLTAHFERETDETTQSTKLMVSTLGRKLAPKLPRFFSEVVLCHVEGSNYYWSTSHPSMDLKHRALPLGSKLAPTFKPVVEGYKKRLELLANANANGEKK